MKALVILSGGQDSTTCLWWAKKYFDEVEAITFDYGQRHRLEIVCARAVAKLAGVTQHELCTLGPILAGKSPLINPDQPLEGYTDFASMDKTIGDRIELTFVPMRNALFLTLAANRAACRGIKTIVTGVCQSDNANYPDCRESFIAAQEQTINEALGTSENGISIATPLMNLEKSDSIILMQKLGGMAALAFTHTAYDGHYPPVGNDHASVLRAEGFLRAGYPDPLVVRAWDEGRMELPRAMNYRDSVMVETGIMTLRDQIRAAKQLVNVDWPA